MEEGEEAAGGAETLEANIPSTRWLGQKFQKARVPSRDRTRGSVLGRNTAPLAPQVCGHSPLDVPHVCSLNGVTNPQTYCCRGRVALWKGHYYQLKSLPLSTSQEDGEEDAAGEEEASPFTRWSSAHPSIEIDVFWPSNCTLRVQTKVLPYALC